MIYVSFSVILVACCNLMLQKLDSISQKYLIFIHFFSVTKIMSGCLSFFAIWLISCKWKKSKHSWSRKTSVRFQSLPWALLVKHKLYDPNTLLTDRHISWLFKIQEAQLYRFCSSNIGTRKRHGTYSTSDLFAQTQHQNAKLHVHSMQKVADRHFFCMSHRQLLILQPQVIPVFTDFSRVICHSLKAPGTKHIQYWQQKAKQ